MPNTPTRARGAGRVGVTTVGETVWDIATT
jgi:hypothetical protein